MRSKKNPRLTVSIATVCLLVISIGSCKNADDTGQSTSTAVDKSDSAGQNQSNAITTTAFLGDGKFAHLAIHKDSLEKFFFTNPPEGLNSKKLVFRFSHDGNSTSSIIIDGFLTKTNNISFLDRPPVILASCGNGASDLSGQKIYLSDLELKKSQYLELRKESGNNLFLAFYPHIVSANPPSKVQFCVTYRMMWISDCQTFAPPQVEITTYDENSDLNPCPPNQPGQ